MGETARERLRTFSRKGFVTGMALEGLEVEVYPRMPFEL
jgi:hypothetical protein